MPRTRFFPVAYKSIRVYFRRAESKITPHGIFIFYANLNSNDALRSRVHLSVSLVFQPLFFFSIEVRSTILLLIFHDAKETKKETLFRRSFSIKFRYVTTVLTSDSFLEEDREQDLLSITKLILSE